MIKLESEVTDEKRSYLPMKKKSSAAVIDDGKNSQESITKVDEMKQDKIFSRTFEQSFGEADKNLEKILTDICEKAWEKEVILKKQKPHCVDWVVASNMQTLSYNLKPDHDSVGVGFDADGDDEPRAGRIDYAQKDKIKVNVKEPYPLMKGSDRAGSAKRGSKKIVRLGTS